MAINRRTYPSFRLTGSTSLTIKRRGKQTLVKGRPVDPTPTSVVIEANVQPLKFTELQQMEESDRTKEWIKIFSVSQLRTLREGDDGWLADIVEWNGDQYEVMKCKNYAMGTLDHFCAYAARIPITAGALP
jgi:hypothetical protein